MTARRPVGCATLADSNDLSQVIVVCDDGTVWVWRRLSIEPNAKGGSFERWGWVRFEEEVPGSAADVNAPFTSELRDAVARACDILAAVDTPDPLYTIALVDELRTAIAHPNPRSGDRP